MVRLQLQQNKAQWCQDAYVRIHGNIRTFGHDRQVVAFQIRAVTDFNEVCPCCSRSCERKTLLSVLQMS